MKYFANSDCSPKHHPNPLVHANAADDDFAGVSQGWEKYYWTPWRAYLEKQA